MVKITLPDGSEKKFKGKVNGFEIAKSIGEGLAKAALAVEVEGELEDLSCEIAKDSEVRILTFKDQEGKEIFWHSSAHLMAQAVLRLFPEAKLTIGPVIETGFYYDIDHSPFTEKDVEKIEEEMKNIVKEDLEVIKEEVSIDNAKKIFKDNSYKQEIIDNIDEFGEGETGEKGKVRIYRQGEFVDLCRGPHVPRTGLLKAFKLTKISGAYWRGDAKNKQLQRLYGVSYPSKKELNKYLEFLEEAEKRDHRKIGREQELFFTDEVSPGSAFFEENGTVIYNELTKLIREEYFKRNYKEVITPQMYDKSLWEISGHWQHYKDDMFTLKVDGRDFSLKPMNCPGHVLMYTKKSRSYRDLPLKIADFSPLHRNELKGTLGGLTRARKFCQDDAHIFATEDQIEEEIIELLKYVDYIYSDIFGFEYRMLLSTKPDKAMGEINLWEKAEESLANALVKNNIPYKLNEGDGAFYGPKIDLMVKDSLDREWQCATIQLDFQMPKRFEATYEGRDGKKHTPIMIHRAILGSVERFIGILIEHYAGKFPLWLSPKQVKVLTLADRNKPYAERVIEELREKGIRAEPSFKTETMNKKIREAQLEQANYIIVVGDKEEEKETVNVRTRDGKVHGEESLSSFPEKLASEIRSRS